MVTLEVLAARFGSEVAWIVAEVPDDKRLTKEMRKAQQISQAPRKSAAAKMVKLADQISSLRAVWNMSAGQAASRRGCGA